jgi:ankyrin repeat protein
MLDCRDRATEIFIIRLIEIDRVNPQPNENGEAIADARAGLQKQYVNLLKCIIRITAKLVMALSGSKVTKIAKILAGIDRWEDELNTLEIANSRCNESLEALFREQSKPKPLELANPGRTELHEAAANGTLHPTHIPLYVQRCGINDRTKNHKWTALMLAADHGHQTAVDALLVYKLDINATDDEGCTALYRAAARGYAGIVRSLLHPLRGARIDLVDNHYRHNALMTASALGHTEVVRLIIKSAGCSKEYLNEKDKEGYTALHGATNNGHAQIVRLLLDAGADPSVKDATGRTAFLDGAQRGYLEIVQALQKSDVDLNERSFRGWTAMHLAAQNDYVKVVEWLVKTGANTQLKTWSGYKAGCTPAEVAKGQSKTFLLGLDTTPPPKK